jgi:hypothetical protein
MILNWQKQSKFEVLWFGFFPGSFFRLCGGGSRGSTGFDSFLIVFTGFFPRRQVNRHVAMGEFDAVFPESLL